MPKAERRLELSDEKNVEVSMNLVLDQSFGVPLIVAGFVFVIIPLLSILGVALTQMPWRD